MIKVKIPDEIPQTLLTEGVKKKLEHCDLYDKNKQSYNNGKETFIFATEVYGSTSVKSSLEAAHYKKCCYCESVFEATSYGEVEHYRPKGVISPKKKGRKIHPGYYWLAYEWNNLLYICKRCNRNKSYYFPLEDDSMRARNHNENIANESPLFVKPSIDDPLMHISFREDAIFGLTVKGKMTIEYLKLDRIGLFESRRESLEAFHAFINIAKITFNNTQQKELYDDAISHIKKRLLPSSAFSAMKSIYFSKFSNDPAFKDM
jgi:5-methylcytosine-specific restriction endonuclease McrA